MAANLRRDTRYETASRQRSRNSPVVNGVTNGVASTASRRRCTEARCLDAQLQCEVLQTHCSQLSHGSATSTTAGSAVIITNGRVSPRMIAITLRFHGCSCLYRGAECHFGRAATRDRESPAGSVRTQTSATHAKTHRASRAGLSQHLTLQRHQNEGSPLRDDDDEGSTTRGERVTTNPLV